MWNLTGDCEQELVTMLQHICLLVPPAQRRQLQILLRYLGKISTNPRLVLHDHYTNRQLVSTSVALCDLTNNHSVSHWFWCVLVWI